MLVGPRCGYLSYGFLCSLFFFKKTKCMYRKSGEVNESFRFHFLVFDLCQDCLIVRE